MSSSTQPPRHLGYLLKHAHLRLTELIDAALAPFGVDGREWAVLLVLDTGEPASQQETAARLGIDRTTMVAFLDTLEHKGLVVRRPRADDRRKNVVELTPSGRDTLHKASQASTDAEREFLTSLTRTAAQQLRNALHTLVRHNER